MNVYTSWFKDVCVYFSMINFPSLIYKYAFFSPKWSLNMGNITDNSHETTFYEIVLADENSRESSNMFIQKRMMT